MSTTFEVLIVHEKKGYALQAANAVFSRWLYLENLLSRFIDSSEIAGLNRLQPGEIFKLTQETWEVLTLAFDLYVATEGRFDISYRSRKQPSGKSALDSLLLSAVSETVNEWPFMASVISGEQTSRWSGLNLDLGGIGKGYALDKATEILEEWGVENYLLNCGTSTILVCGAGPENQGWPVGVGGDALSGEAGVVRLWGGAISGSGPQVKGRHHIDPSVGKPAELYDGVWAYAPTAAISDALSTAAIVSPPHQIEAQMDRVSFLGGTPLMHRCGILTTTQMHHHWEIQNYSFHEAIAGDRTE